MRPRPVPIAGEPEPRKWDLNSPRSSRVVCLPQSTRIPLSSLRYADRHSPHARLHPPLRERHLPLSTFSFSAHRVLIFYCAHAPVLCADVYEAEARARCGPFVELLRGYLLRVRYCTVMRGMCAHSFVRVLHRFGALRVVPEHSLQGASRVGRQHDALVAHARPAGVPTPQPRDLVRRRARARARPRRQRSRPATLAPRPRRVLRARGPHDRRPVVRSTRPLPAPPAAACSSTDPIPRPLRRSGARVRAGGGRWMHAAGGAGLLVERVVAKDNY